MKDFVIKKSITDRSCKGVDLFLKDVERIKQISAEREKELGELLLKDGKVREKAIQELMNGNLRFLVSVAKKFQNLGLPLEDLISEGSIGLRKAAERFDHTKGFKFITYARNEIVSAIQEAIIKKGGVVRVPKNKAEIVRKYHKWSNEKEQILGYKPSIDMFLDEYSLSGDMIYALLAPKRFESLDTVIPDTNGAILEDMCESGCNADRNIIVTTELAYITELLGKFLTSVEIEFLYDITDISGKNYEPEYILWKYELKPDAARKLKSRIIGKIKKSEYAKDIQEALLNITEAYNAPGCISNIC